MKRTFDAMRNIYTVIWRVSTFLGVLATGILTSGIVLPANAQVSSDGTTNTTVNSSGNNFTIINGIENT